MYNLFYTKLEVQIYLKLENINAEEARILFRYRTRMAKYGENVHGQNGPVNCPLCGLHLDSQAMAYNNCKEVKQNLSLDGNYSDIFKSDISNNLVKSLVNIDKLREEHLSQNIWEGSNLSRKEANSTSILGASSSDGNYAFLSLLELLIYK